MRRIEEDHYCFGCDPLSVFMSAGGCLVHGFYSAKPSRKLAVEVTPASRQQAHARDTGITVLPPVAPGLLILITLKLELYVPDVALGGSYT